MLACGVMEGDRQISFCFYSLVQALAKCGEAVRAATWLQRGIDAGADPSVPSMSCVISSLARAGHIIEAENWLSRMAAVAPARATAICQEELKEAWNAHNGWWPSQT